MARTNESQFIVQHFSNISATSGRCKQYRAFALCLYLFPSCELQNVDDPTSGSQLIICREKCAGFQKLYQECVNKEEIAAENSQNKALHELVSMAEKFMCSDPDTYIIPQVPVSMRLCDDISYIDHLLPSEGKTYACS